MEAIIRLTNELAGAIENCDSRAKYFEAKEIIMQNEALLLKIKEFKRMHTEFQIKLLNGPKPSFDEERIVSGLYSELMLNQYTRQFLQCEKNLMDVILNIQTTVFEKVGIDVDL